MPKKIFIVAVFVFLLTAFLLPGEIKAIEDENVVLPRFEQVNPDKPFEYGIKRLTEKIELIFQITPERKASFYKKLLQRRFSELVYVVEKKDIGNIEKTSQRYETAAGQLADLIVNKNLNSEKKPTVELFLEHSKIIEKIKNNFEFNSAEWRFVENDINSLKIYLEELK